MTIDEAIKILNTDHLAECEVDAERFNEAYNMATKAMETVQRIDDVLNAEGMTADDAIHEIIVAIDEYKYDCGVIE